MFGIEIGEEKKQNAWQAFAAPKPPVREEKMERYNILNAVNTRALPGGQECGAAWWEFLGNVIHEFANFP